MRQSHGLFRPSDAFFRPQFSADYIISIPGFDFRQAQYGQTGRFFLPLNFMIGWKPTEHMVISAEFGIPIIKEFPVYTFKTQVRIGYLF